jgi:hypothetical protein
MLSKAAYRVPSEKTESCQTPYQQRKGQMDLGKVGV